MFYFFPSLLKTIKTKEWRIERKIAISFALSSHMSTCYVYIQEPFQLNILHYYIDMAVFLFPKSTFESDERVYLTTSVDLNNFKNIVDNALVLIHYFTWKVSVIASSHFRRNKCFIKCRSTLNHSILHVKSLVYNDRWIMIYYKPPV